MLNESQIITVLQRVNPRLSGTSIDPDTTLAELNLDSLDRFSLLAELQEETGIEIPDADVGQLVSVRAIMEYLEGRAG